MENVKQIYRSVVCLHCIAIYCWCAMRICSDAKLDLQERQRCKYRRLFFVWETIEVSAVLLAMSASVYATFLSFLKQLKGSRLLDVPFCCVFLMNYTGLSIFSNAGDVCRVRPIVVMEAIVIRLSYFLEVFCHRMKSRFSIGRICGAEVHVLFEINCSHDDKSLDFGEGELRGYKLTAEDLHDIESLTKQRAFVLVSADIAGASKPVAGSVTGGEFSGANFGSASRMVDEHEEADLVGMMTVEVVEKTSSRGQLRELMDRCHDVCVEVLERKSEAAVMAK